MAKKPAKKAVEVKRVATKAPASKRGAEVRNSPVPKRVVGTQAAAPAVQRREVTREMIAQRASEIARSEHAGDDLHNWLRAERELHGA